MKHIKTIAIITLMAVSLTLTIKQFADKAQRLEQWEQDRQIITVIIRSGDTLDKYCYKYKPDWMDVRDYREYIKDLNDMPTSDIYAGDVLKFYIDTQQND